MSPVQNRYRIVDARGSSRGRVEIAPTAGDDCLILEASSPTFKGPPTEVRLVVRQKDLLEALGAEPDESDYREVVDENERLGRKLSAAVSKTEKLERELSREAPLRDLQDAATPPATDWEKIADDLYRELREVSQEVSSSGDSLRLAERDLDRARAKIARLEDDLSQEKRDHGRTNQYLNQAERDRNSARNAIARLKRDLFEALAEWILSGEKTRG